MNAHACQSRPSLIPALQRLRRRRPALSLRLRFVAFLGAVTIGLSCAFGSFDLLADLQRERDAHAQRAGSIAGTVRAIAETFLTDYQYLTLQSFLEAMARESGVVSIAIYDWRRSYLVDSDPSTALGRSDRIPVLIAEAHGRQEPQVLAGDGRLTVAFPIDIDFEDVAAGQIVVDMPTTWQILSGIAWRTGSVLALAVLVTAPLAWLLLGRMLQPLQQLADACRRVGRGEVEVEIAARRRDEIGLLTVRFRRMFRQLRRNMARIHHLAFVDSVTDLPNREHFRRAAERAIERANATRRPGAVLFIDLDRFKQVNDTLGHDFGDLLLRAVAKRLHGCIRASDAVARIGVADLGQGGALPFRDPTIARLGGDEFSLLLPQMRVATDAAIVARRILQAVRQPFELRGHRVFVSASIGIAIFPDDGQTLEDLLRAADLALYHAKDQGRCTFEFFSKSLNSTATERFTLENELRSAIENEEFELYYQPIVDPRCRSLRGVEALLRWRHPTRGIVDPGDFIGVAEETRMIIEIGSWVLRTACRQAHAWHLARRSTKVSVNVSLAQFARPGFADTVLAVLRDVGLPPHLLQLEITESMAMSDPEHTAAIVKPLRAVGVCFALDDFGTGYSSLSILSSLPFDGLKIDRSFISRAESDDNARVIVETILAMARSLCCAAIAEGIEEGSQAEFLAARGCTLAQGYYYSRPVPAAMLEETYFAPGHTEAVA